MDTVPVFILRGQSCSEISTSPQYDLTAEKDGRVIKDS